MPAADPRPVSARARHVCPRQLDMQRQKRWRTRLYATAAAGTVSQYRPRHKPTLLRLPAPPAAAPPENEAVQRAFPSAPPPRSSSRATSTRLNATTVGSRATGSVVEEVRAARAARRSGLSRRLRTQASNLRCGRRP